jgi:hypothetical protein
MKSKHIVDKAREFFFRGLYIPVDLLELCWRQTITNSELSLLAYVDAMVNWQGTGCTASNNTLAFYVGKSYKHIQHMILKLKKLGLLYDVSTSRDQRILETKWSRIGAPRTPEGGDLMGKVPPALWVRSNRYKGKDITQGRGDIGMSPGPDDSFFPEEERVKRKYAREEDYKCARRLREILHKHRPSGVLFYREEDWAKHFRTLRRRLGDEDTIEEVLEWFSCHIGEKGLPTVRNAKQFSTAFDWIRDRMNRNGGPRIKEFTYDDCSDRGKRLVDSIKHFQWPKGSKDQLPTVAENSYRNFKKLFDAVRQFPEWLKRQHNKDAAALISLNDNYVKSSLSGDFLERWYKAYFSTIKNWKDWSGKIPIFNTEDKRFDTWGRGLSMSYTSSTKLWDQYWKLLQESMK